MDHFQQDPEAQPVSYTSGTSPYHTPSDLRRSRSPTPGRDNEDDDYTIGGDGRIQVGTYAGRTGSDYQKASGYGYTYNTVNAYDEEKTALANQYSQDLGTLPSLTYATAWGAPLRGDGASEKTASSVTDGSDSTYTNSRFSQASNPTDPQSPLPTRHFGPAPVGRVARRLGHKRRVPLVNGHLTVDLDVPDRLKTVLPMSSAGKDGTDETTKLRYTAVMGDPDDFVKSYWLRQNQYGRGTELIVVITMYNVSLVFLVKSSGC